MAGEYPRGMLELWEDFLTDNVTDLVETAVDSGVQDILDKHGGWWRQTLPAGEADALSIAGERAWEVDEGHPLIFETRLVVSAVTDFCVCVGFGDDVDSDSLAILIQDEAGSLTSNAADGFAFMVEGDQDATWQAVGVDTDVDNTQVALTNGADVAAAMFRLYVWKPIPTILGQLNTSLTANSFRLRQVGLTQALFTAQFCLVMTEAQQLLLITIICMFLLREANVKAFWGLGFN